MHGFDKIMYQFQINPLFCYKTFDMRFTAFCIEEVKKDSWLTTLTTKTNRCCGCVLGYPRAGAPNFF